MAMLYHNQNPQNIADVLVIGRSTVNSHIKHLYAKLSIHSRLDLMRRIDQYKADF
jgi:DNA-binding CsgD family transcriptional regulator